MDRALNKSGKYNIPEDATEIVSQAITFDPQKKKNDDDLIDTIAYGPQMMEEYIGLIMAVFNPVTLHQVQRESEMVGV